MLRGVQKKGYINTYCIHYNIPLSHPLFLLPSPFLSHQEELEKHPISNVSGIQAVLDTCNYNSVLTVSVWEDRKRGTSVFMFQCDSLGVSQQHTNEPVFDYFDHLIPLDAVI